MTTWPRGWPGKRGVPPAAITFAVAPTASIAGGVQIAARVIETGLHKMDALGLRRDPRAERDRHGADPAGGEERHPRHRPHQRQRSSTAAASLHLAERGRRSARRDRPKGPSDASPDYGSPFRVIFERYQHDFYKIDPMLFSPAEVWLTSAITGRTFHAGSLNPDVLGASLYGN